MRSLIVIVALLATLAGAGGTYAAAKLHIIFKGSGITCATQPVKSGGVTVSCTRSDGNG